MLKHHFRLDVRTLLDIEKARAPSSVSHPLSLKNSLPALASVLPLCRPIRPPLDPSCKVESLSVLFPSDLCSSRQPLSLRLSPFLFILSSNKTEVAPSLPSSVRTDTEEGRMGRKRTDREKEESYCKKEAMERESRREGERREGPPFLSASLSMQSPSPLSFSSPLPWSGVLCGTLCIL